MSEGEHRVLTREAAAELVAEMLGQVWRSALTWADLNGRFTSAEASRRLSARWDSSLVFFGWHMFTVISMCEHKKIKQRSCGHAQSVRQCDFAFIPKDTKARRCRTCVCNRWVLGV